jgi:DnaJ domain
MATVLVGIAALLVVLWFLHKFVQASPKGAANIIQKGGGVAALIGAVFLGSRGQLAVALPLGFMGLGLLGWMPFGNFGLWGQKSPGQVSRVRSAFLEMELDHDSGTMRGRVIAGQRSGTALETLDTTAIVGLLAELDDESRQLLMAYLDRRDPRWREHAQTGADTRERGPLRSGKMTEEEAYQILGLEPGASPEEIGRSHRMLMKKLHPDQGGSTYLAARVNEAKEVLLRRHR